MADGTPLRSASTTDDRLGRLQVENEALEARVGLLLVRVQEAERALRRAAFVAEHLFQMIDPQTWRDHGGDDGQGHYEGDYRAEQTLKEIKSWAVLGGDVPE